MLPADKRTRDLLPFTAIDLQESVGSDARLGEAAAAGDVLPLPHVPFEARHIADLLQFKHVLTDGHVTVPIKDPVHSPATPAPLAHDDPDGYAAIVIRAPPHFPAASHELTSASGGTERAQTASPALNLEIAIAKPTSITHHQESGARAHQEDTRDRPVPQDGDKDPHAASQGSWMTGNQVNDTDHTHSITVAQNAEVDQDASIIINGYAGAVVARLHMDQDLLMDQDVDIDFTIDGDGHFSVLLDQDMCIEQDIDIDLHLFDADRVLYVDLFLTDRVLIEQDTTLQMQIGDGPPGGTVEVHQNLEIDQDVAIDIDVEDDLEERYLVKIDVDVEQDVNAGQDAIVDVTDRAGEIDMDVDAFQTASVDQDTSVRIDFVAV
jgi:hypothetical protein